MKTVQLQLTITLDDGNTRALAEVLGAAFKQATQPAIDADDKRQALLRASQIGNYGGEDPSEDQGLLIDSRQAAKLLKVSERTLWTMHNTGLMPAPIRFGRVLRWSLEVLRKWVDAGCPTSSQRD